MRGVFIPWNTDTQSITISTDSEVGTNETVMVMFAGNNSVAGAVFIYFDTPIQYILGYCTHVKPFTDTLHTDTQKTWTITYNTAKQRIVLHCNGVQVLNVLLTSVCTDSRWRDWWERKPTHIQFHLWDRASDSYKISSKTGEYNGVSGCLQRTS